MPVASDLNIPTAKVAVSATEIVPKSGYESTGLAQDDRIEIVHLPGRMMSENQPTDDTLTIAGRAFTSGDYRHGQHADYAENAVAAEAAGRNCDRGCAAGQSDRPNAPMLADFIDPQKFTYLPNTAGCFTGEDAGAIAIGAAAVMLVKLSAGR